MVVMKFGGTSIGNGRRILEVAEIVAKEKARQPIVVVSAVSQVTNLLVELTNIATKASQSKLTADVDGLKHLHYKLAQELQLKPDIEAGLKVRIDNLIGELQKTLDELTVSGQLTPRVNDKIICFGERLSVHLIASALQKNGLEAKALEANELIVTDDSFGNAQPLFEASGRQMKPVLEPLIKKQIIPVITGYMAADSAGHVTTLGRGGSDYSATIIGNCMRADEVWIWTDVDGVMTADPRAVKGAHTVKELSYDEAAELSYFGAKVLHPRTMVAAALNNTPVFIKNTMQPAATGTKISQAAYQHPDGAKAMSMLKNLSLITIQGKGMQGVVGVAARVFNTLADQQVNILFISQASSENNISLVINATDGRRATQALKETFQTELTAKNIEAVQEETALAMIAVVGEGMRNHVDIAGRIFSALGSAKINVIAIAQGSSERNISLVVSENDATRALQSIHDELHLENGKTGKKV